MSERRAHLDLVRTSLATPSARLTPRERWILAWILVGALVVRLIVMWMPGDQMFQYGQIFYEELQRGNATHDLMQGALLPVFDYTANPFSLGSLLDSYLAIPLFFVLGPTANALRIVSLFYGIPLIWVTFLLVRRKYSLRAAVAASSLIAFGPPGFVLISSTVFGAHPEATFLSLLLVWLWFSWNDAGRSGVVRSLVLGTAVGIGLWYSYGLLVIVGILLLHTFAITRFWPLRANALWIGIGFLCGFAPWIAYVVTHPGTAFVIYEKSLTDHVQAGLLHTDKLAKLSRLIVDDAPDAFWFHGAWPEGGHNAARALVYVFIAVILWCAWIGRSEIAELVRALVRRRPGFAPSLRVVSLLFMGSWFGAYVLTDFVFDEPWSVQGYRYLVPPWPFLAILLGIAVADLAVRGRTLIPSLVVGAVCVTHVTFTVAQSRPDRWKAQWLEPGTRHLWHMRFLVLRFGWNEELMLHVLRRTLETRTPEQQRVLVEDLARGIARFATEPAGDPLWAARKDQYKSTLEALCNHGPEPFRATFERARTVALENVSPR